MRNREFRLALVGLVLLAVIAFCQASAWWDSHQAKATMQEIATRQASEHRLRAACDDMNAAFKRLGEIRASGRQPTEDEMEEYHRALDGFALSLPEEQLWEKFTVTAEGHFEPRQ